MTEVQPTTITPTAAQDLQITDENVKVERSLTRKTLITVAVTTGFLLVLALFWYGMDIILLAFAGVLLAVFLNGLAHYVSEWTKLTRGWSLLIVSVSLIGLMVGLGFLLAPGIAQQSDELSKELPKSVEKLRDYIGQYEWGHQLLESIPKMTKSLGSQPGLLSKVSGAVSTTATIVMNLLIVLAIGIYFAVEPSLYRRGFIKLLPQPDRRRAHEVMDAVGNTLWWWLIGVMMSMTTIGILTILGLWAIGIPLAPTLGLLTGLLAFIPNFGPIASAIPPMLLGLMISPQTALYVGALYLAVQAVESNIVTPQIQKRTVSMPPVLGIVSQLLFGIFFGFLGLMLATPIVAALVVIIRMLYVEDTLGDREEESNKHDNSATTEKLTRESPVAQTP